MGGRLPSSPSPLARLVSSGLVRKTRTGTAKNGRVVCHTPPSLIATPPPASAWHFACPAPCPETARKMRSALARQLGSGEPETRPNMETVNRAVRGRFGGCAFPRCRRPPLRSGPRIERPNTWTSAIRNSSRRGPTSAYYLRFSPNLKRIQVEGYACCGVRPVLVIVRPRHDSCRHRPTASPPIVDCYVDRRLAAARASRFCFSRGANARSRAFSATPCCSDSGRDAIQALSASFVARCLLICASSAASVNRFNRENPPVTPTR